MDERSTLRPSALTEGGKGVNGKGTVRIRDKTGTRLPCCLCLALAQHQPSFWLRVSLAAAPCQPSLKPSPAKVQPQPLNRSSLGLSTLLNLTGCRLPAALARH